MIDSLTNLAEYNFTPGHVKNFKTFCELMYMTRYRSVNDSEGKICHCHNARSTHFDCILFRAYLFTFWHGYCILHINVYICNFLVAIATHDNGLSPRDLKLVFLSRKRSLNLNV